MGRTRWNSKRQARTILLRNLCANASSICFAHTACLKIDRDKFPNHGKYKSQSQARKSNIVKYTGFDIEWKNKTKKKIQQINDIQGCIFKISLCIPSLCCRVFEHFVSASTSIMVPFESIVPFESHVPARHSGEL